MDLGLKGRVAIVAAASKGLGRAVADELAKEGCEVAICARTAGELERAAKEIEAASGRSVFWRAMDVTKEDAVRGFVADVEKKFGRVDICVTNAGGPPAKKFLDITVEEWRAAVDLTLMSAVYFAREVLPRMQKNKWGRLLTITSVSVKQPIDGLLLSNSLRAAVTGMAKTLANEFGASGITVNNVCPGYTGTDRLNELATRQAQMTGKRPEEIFAAWSAQIPIGRIARPDEFAAMVAFLASERAASINGATIPIDGGWVKGLL
jgi:3-oxoacyl-[acyl-carrier protein] reductase